MFFKCATLTIPPNTPLFRAGDWTLRTFVTPLVVSAKMASYKDGRPKGSKPVWVFTANNYFHYLKVEHEPLVTVSDVRVVKKEN